MAAKKPTQLRKPMGPQARRALEKIRALCLAHPEVEERLAHGAPCFYVRKKVFVMFVDNHHGDGRLAIWCRAAPGAQDTLVSAAPDRYFVPPYVGHSGFVGARLEGSAPWGQLSALIAEGWALSAPKKLLDAR